MRLGVMQPYFFPYIGYYQGIYAVDKFILYDKFSYIKSGWINRNRILVVKREPIYITVPVKKESSYKNINEIEIVDNIPWRKNILKTIFYNYKSSPFFDEVYPIIKGIVEKKYKLLKDLSSKSIIDVCNYLDIGTNIVKDTSKYNQLENKLIDDELDASARFADICLNYFDKKTIRIIEMCREEEANVYINPISGQELYDEEEFKKNGIKLLFLQKNEYSYQQSTENFFPHLSIIDVLMNCGKEGTKELLYEYVLV